MKTSQLAAHGFRDIGSWRCGDVINICPPYFHGDPRRALTDNSPYAVEEGSSLKMLVVMLTVYCTSMDIIPRANLEHSALLSAASQSGIWNLESGQIHHPVTSEF